MQIFKLSSTKRLYRYTYGPMAQEGVGFSWLTNKNIQNNHSLKRCGKLWAESIWRSYTYTFLVRSSSMTNIFSRLKMKRLALNLT